MDKGSVEVAPHCYMLFPNARADCTGQPGSVVIPTFNGAQK